MTGAEKINASICSEVHLWQTSLEENEYRNFWGCAWWMEIEFGRMLENAGGKHWYVVSESLFSIQISWNAEKYIIVWQTFEFHDYQL